MKYNQWLALDTIKEESYHRNGLGLGSEWVCEVGSGKQTNNWKCDISSLTLSSDLTPFWQVNTYAKYPTMVAVRCRGQTNEMNSVYFWAMLAKDFRSKLWSRRSANNIQIFNRRLWRYTYTCYGTTGSSLTKSGAWNLFPMISIFNDPKLISLIWMTKDTTRLMRVNFCNCLYLGYLLIIICLGVPTYFCCLNIGRKNAFSWCRWPR